MGAILITGCNGLIGSEAVRFFHDRGMDVFGVDNDMRARLFGKEASTSPMGEKLKGEFPNFRYFNVDIRDHQAMKGIYSSLGGNLALIIHTAAQPSHDWAAQDPMADFSINATATLDLLELTRRFSPEAVFIFTSTNKVYGDRINSLPFRELERRWELEEGHPYYDRGVDEGFSLDQTTHSLFGVSKVAADLMVQEYGRYFGLKTAVFRAGCLTGPNHRGTVQHGFLSHLVRNAVLGRPYTVFGHKGKQVRDNIHALDLVTAFWEFFQRPRSGEVYNIGGGRNSHGSVLEMINMLETVLRKRITFNILPEPRRGDHQWWVSDCSKFRGHYQDWRPQYSLPDMIEEMISAVSSHEDGPA